MKIFWKEAALAAAYTLVIASGSLLLSGALVRLVTLLLRCPFSWPITAAGWLVIECAAVFLLVRRF